LCTLVFFEQDVFYNESQRTIQKRFHDSPPSCICASSRANEYMHFRRNASMMSSAQDQKQNAEASKKVHAGACLVDMKIRLPYWSVCQSYVISGWSTKAVWSGRWDGPTTRNCTRFAGSWIWTFRKTASACALALEKNRKI